jgi:hypothetical protein
MKSLFSCALMTFTPFLDRYNANKTAANILHRQTSLLNLAKTMNGPGWAVTIHLNGPFSQPLPIL